MRIGVLVSGVGGIAFGILMVVDLAGASSSIDAVIGRGCLLRPTPVRARLCARRRSLCHLKLAAGPYGLYERGVNRQSAPADEGRDNTVESHRGSAYLKSTDSLKTAP